MKRPLAVFGLIYLTASAVAVCLFPEVNFILSVTAAILAIAAVFVAREKLRDILIVLCPVCIALAVMGCCQVRANRLSDHLSGQSCVISGEIYEIPRMQYGRWRYVIETDRIDIRGAKQHIRLLITSRNSIEEAREGDHLTCEVQFLRGSSETGYSSTTSLRADGVNARAWYKPYTERSLIRGSTRLRYIPMQIKRVLITQIRKALPDSASAMLCGMLLGDTGYMKTQTVENFRATGIAHLLAVSGLHLSLLTVTIEKTLKRLKRSRKTTSVTVICFILAFMAVTGFTPSVVRAGGMHMMVHIGRIANRNVDSLTSMSIAILLMCLVNPWAAADIGLQLSVCSTLGLLFMARRVDRKVMQLSRRLWCKLIQQGRLQKILTNRTVKTLGKFTLRSLAVSATAGISILPLTAIHFGSVSLISPLTNVLCVYAASLFIIAGIIATLIYCLPLIGWIVSLPLRFIAALLGAYLETAAGTLAKLPFSTWNTSYRYTPYLLFFILLIAVSAVIIHSRINDWEFTARLRKYVLCELVIMIFVAILSHEIFCKGPEITVFDVNNGGICVCAKNRTHAVFAEAGGDSYNLSVIKETLRAKGVMKVDAVAVSDEAVARCGNIDRLLAAYKPDCVITDIDRSIRSNARVLPFQSGIQIDSLDLGVETFTDGAGGKWERLLCGDTAVLICPDNGNCALLPDEWLHCDAAVLGKKINGISTLSVGTVIISGKEKNADTLCKSLQNIGYRHVYTTAASGNITLSKRGEELLVHISE